MSPNAPPESLPFEQAIQFFRAKLRLQQSAKWADMLHEQHTNAFTVAGAESDAILNSFYQATETAISQGTTLDDFRADFDQIVKANGWSHNGSRNWRSRVIYQTNLSTAYAAGRYAQMTDPEVKRARPYWQYVHDDSVDHPRLDHLRWDGLTLEADDPWWDTHYPPNGWGCCCTVKTLSSRQLAALGKSGPDKAPPLEMELKPLNTSKGRIEIEVPKGIDPGWGYRPGAGAEIPIPNAISAPTIGPSGRAPLTSGDWQSWGRPEIIPPDPLPTALGPHITDEAVLRDKLAEMLGGVSGVFTLPTHRGVVVSAKDLAYHLLGRPGRSDYHPERTAYIPLIPELLRDPYEIWAAYEEFTDGTIHLRQRIFRVFDTTKYGRMMMIFEAEKGLFVDVTFVTFKKDKDINKARKGALIYARPGT